MSMIPSFPEDTPSYFADAESDIDLARAVIFGVPLDKSVCFRRGARQGPAAIRKASWNFETFDYLTGVDFSEILVHDYGDVDIGEDQDISTIIDRVTNITQKIFEKKKIPVCLGGEHTAIIGITKALPRHCHVIIIDAHADFRDSYLDQSLHHACTVRRIVERIGSDNLTLIGLRSAEKQEYLELQQSGMTVIDALSINRKGIDQILSSDTLQIDSTSPVYLSIDIDAIDPGFAPGTGSPEPFGLHPSDILPIIDTYEDRLIGFDVMEVNPLYDHGETALLAAKIIRYGLACIHKVKKRLV